MKVELGSAAFWVVGVEGGFELERANPWIFLWNMESPVGEPLQGRGAYIHKKGQDNYETLRT